MAMEETTEGVQPPRAGEVMMRDAEGLPVDVNKIEVLDMVTDAERQMHLLGLKKAGIPEDTLKQLKALKGLASSTGHFIAQSLEMTSRSYYVQILELMELSKALHKRLMKKAGDDDFIASNEERAMLNRNYIEMVKEAGRAFELMLMAAQAMVKMMQASEDDSKGTGLTRKPAWGKTNGKLVESAPNA